jgi:hypothetical protein
LNARSDAHEPPQARELGLRGLISNCPKNGELPTTVANHSLKALTESVVWLRVKRTKGPADLASTLAHGQEEHWQHTSDSYQQHRGGSYQQPSRGGPAYQQRGGGGHQQQEFGGGSQPQHTGSGYYNCCLGYQ